MLEKPGTAPTMIMINTIMAARKIWGVEQKGNINSFGENLWPGFQFSVRSGEEWFLTDYPSLDLVERVTRYPALDVAATRSIFGAESLLSFAQFFSSD